MIPSPAARPSAGPAGGPPPPTAATFERFMRARAAVSAGPGGRGARAEPRDEAEACTACSGSGRGGRARSLAPQRAGKGARCGRPPSSFSKDVASLVARPDPDAAHAFDVDLLHLASVDPDAATALLARPAAGLAALAAALADAQKTAASASPSSTTFKPRAVPVLRPPPVGLLATDAPVRRLAARHAGALVSLAGTVVRAGSVRAMEAAAEYECGGCGAAVRVEADLSTRELPLPPRACAGVTRAGRSCKGAYRLLAMEHDDVQEVVLAEGAAGLAPRDRPRAVAAVLRGPLAGALAAGDDAAVTGVLVARWTLPLRDGKRPEVELAVLAAGAARSPRARPAAAPGAGSRLEAWRDLASTRPLAARDALAAAVAPSLAALAPIKLAIALQLAAPPAREGGAAGGGRARADVHVLLRGPPGVGKTALLRAAAALAPRSVFACGGATTAAGLTAAAVRELDGGGWALEAGALALADGGLAALDRLDALPAGDRAALHEAMEQQTVTVAKAGLVATLNTRAAVLAAAGPAPAHGRAGARGPRSSAATTALEAPLLSRFDLVFDLADGGGAAFDGAVCDAVLADARGLPPSPGALLTPADLRDYASWLKASALPPPMLTPDAERVLAAAYRIRRREAAAARGAPGGGATLRSLESLTRLTVAHARLLGRTEAGLQDAVCAVVLSAAAAGRAAGVPGLAAVDPVTADFVADADIAYAADEAAVLAAVAAEEALTAAEAGGGEAPRLPPADGGY